MIEGGREWVNRVRLYVKGYMGLGSICYRHWQNFHGCSSRICNWALPFFRCGGAPRPGISPAPLAVCLECSGGEVGGDDRQLHVARGRRDLPRASSSPPQCIQFHSPVYK